MHGSDDENVIKLQGFIDIEIESPNGNKRKIHKNTITNAGKQYFLGRCANRMLSAMGVGFGKSAISEYIGLNDFQSGSTRYTGSEGDDAKCVHNVLLNMGNDLQADTPNTTLINSFSSSFTTPDKLVGHAGNAIESSANNEGVLDLPKEEYVADPYTVACRWRYPAGVASGLFDTIAIMPAGCYDNVNKDGIRYMKCLDYGAAQDSLFAGSVRGFLPPNVPGYTESDEILIYFDNRGGKKWKYNIQTGEMTKLDDAAQFISFPAPPISGTVYSPDYMADYLVSGNYMYVLRNTVGSTSATNRTLYIDTYDLSTGNLLATRSKSTGSTSRIYASKFLSYNGKVYVDTLGSSKSSNFKVTYEVNTSASVWEFGTEVTIANILSIPAGLDPKDVMFGNYGEQFVMFVHCFTEYYSAGSKQYYDGMEFKGYVYGSLSDLSPSNIVDCIEGLFNMAVLFSNGSNAGVIQVGFNPDTSIEFNTNGQRYNSEDFNYTVRNAQGDFPYARSYNYSIYLSLNGWWTNAISYVKLDEPIQKGDDDTVRVTYGYKIV